MTTRTLATNSARKRTVLWWLIAGGVLIVIGANVHLAYVAMTSQPDCISHLQAGEGSAERGLFSAAESSCTPE